LSRSGAPSIRVALAAVLAAAVVAAPAASASAPAAPAASASAPAAGGVGSAYRGKSSQGIAVTLSAPSGSERTFRYRASMKCTDGTTWLDDYFTDRVIVRGERFSSHHSSERGAIVTTVTGTLAGKQAHGTIRILERFSATPTAAGVTPLSGTGTIRCQSPTVRWHAVAR